MTGPPEIRFVVKENTSSTTEAAKGANEAVINPPFWGFLFYVLLL